MRYFGVRVNSVGFPARASSTARTLFSESPIPIDISRGMYFNAGLQLRPISLCEET